MGANASRGTDNQSLMDRLLDSRCPVPSDVERAMRLVDRGDYFEERSSRAYIDLAWRSGHIHLSAPSIYLSVLRHLDLAPGQSFLNVGSGSGYFNTVAGLILGYRGINHGIELIPENVEFARKQLHRFMNESDAPLERDFCVPLFVQGNIFHLLSSSENESSPTYNGPTLSDGTQSDSEPEENREPVRHAEPNADMDQSDDVSADVTVGDLELNDAESQTDHSPSGYCLQVAIEPAPPFESNSTPEINGRRWPLYDRMYIGAAVRNRTHLKSILRFLKIGGVLIAPVQDELVKITRLSTNRIRRVDLMSVSFAPLIIPQRGTPTLQISPPSTEAPTLLRLCARVLRSILRRRIEARHNGVPTLGRLQEVDSDVECKKPRQVDGSADPDAPTTSSDLSSSYQNSESDSDSTDMNTDDQPNGHASGSPQSDRSGSPENQRPSVAMRRLLRHLLHHSHLSSSSETPATPNPSGGDRPQELDSEPDPLARSGLWMVNLMQDRDSDEHEQEGQLHVQVHVTNRLISAFARAETSQASANPQAPASSTGQATNGNRQRKNRHKKRLQYQPPSYRYRDEMKRMMSDDLKLPDFFIRDALLI